MDKNKLWRVLVRVVNICNDKVELIIPSWKTDETIRRHITDFPIEMIDNLKEGYRFHCQCNVDCDKAENIILTDFELS